MQSRLLRIALGAALILAGYGFGTHSANTIRAEMRNSIPLYYGKVVAGDSSSLWFEDTNGTLRQVTIPAGNTVYTINRQK